MIKQIISILIVIYLVVCINSIAIASWPALSVGDLIKDSNLVLIGEIEKNMGIKNDNVEWLVKIKYLLKGDVKSKELVVVTPSKSFSTHYDLDQWGKSVLLFLNKSDNFYIPMTPQGVISINLKGNLKGKVNLTGEELVNNIDIIGGGRMVESKDELTKFIQSSNVVVLEKEIPNTTDESVKTDRNKNVKLKNNITFFIYGCFSIVIVGVVYFIKRKFFSKK